ncbi:MAG: pyruvate dehydrogenase complex E1 component subunit beta [Hyphomicrobiales bacterium]|nr:pyruvate dehydrogenase complex E1 component subunit beta [Hyphomicrobiales bacterium]
MSAARPPRAEAPLLDIRLPSLPGASGGFRLTRWLCGIGERVNAGDVIAEIAGEASTFEIESPGDGILMQQVVSAGSAALAAGVLLGTISERPRAEAALHPSSAPVAEPAPQGEMPAPRAGSRNASMREALRSALADEMRREPLVFVIGEEVGEYDGANKVTQGLLAEFGPARVVDTPITEHAFAGLAVGAALAGMRPVVEFMTFNFALQAMDHIMNSAAKARYISGGQVACPIVFRGPNGGAPRVGAQHTHDFAAMFANIPGLLVVAPATASDAAGLLRSAIRNNNPVMFLEHELLYGESGELPDDPEHLVPIGEARIARAGTDVTLVAYSITVSHALSAAAQLASEGISAEVIDLRSLRPLDVPKVLESVRRTGRCVTVEEGWPQSGIGAEIAAQVAEHAFAALKAPVLRVAAVEVPMPYAARLEALAQVSAQQVIEAVRKVMAPQG